MAETNFSQNDEIGVENSSKIGTLIGVLLILVSLVVYVFFTRALSDRVSIVETDIEAKNSQIASIQSKINEFQSAEGEFGLETEVQRLEAKKSIPKGVNQDDVIRDIIEITDTNDVSLNSISFGKGATDKKGISSLRVNASFEGNFSDLIGFLRSVEQNARLIVVNTISVQLSALSVTNSQRANFTLAMETYYQQ